MPDSIRLNPPAEKQKNCPGKPAEHTSRIPKAAFTLVLGHPQQLDHLSEIWSRTRKRGHTWQAISVPPFPKSGIWRIKDWLHTPAGEAIARLLWQPDACEVVMLQDDLRYLDIVAVRLCPTRRSLRYTLRGDIAIRELGCRPSDWHRLDRECMPLAWSVLKRALDLAGAMVLLPFAVAITLTVMPLIAAVNRGRVFNRTIAVGLHGRPFELWSFAGSSPQDDTEVVDLNSRHRAFGGRHRQSFSSVVGLLQTLGLQPLPGLLRVLSGQMSLFGQRAVTLSEVLEMRNEGLEYLKRKPGLFSLSRRNGSAQ